eukprot:4404691-Pyramimonas_sp.AAC.1
MSVKNRREKRELNSPVTGWLSKVLTANSTVSVSSDQLLGTTRFPILVTPQPSRSHCTLHLTVPLHRPVRHRDGADGAAARGGLCAHRRLRRTGASRACEFVCPQPVSPSPQPVSPSPQPVNPSPQPVNPSPQP